MSKTNYLKILNLLKIFIIILCVVAFAGLLMPYEKSIGEYRERLIKYPETMNIEEVKLTNKDAINLSILENFKVYNYAMNNSKDAGYNSDYIYGESLINVIITIVLIVSIALVLLFTILNKNVLIIIFDIILAISSLAMNYDITSRGVLPSDNYTYGISYYLYIVIAILIIISVIAKIVMKKKEKKLVNDSLESNKKEEKSKEIKISNNTNALITYLKKYWYVAIIIVLIVIVLILLLSNKSNSNMKNNLDLNESQTTNNSKTNENTNNEKKNTNNNPAKTGTSENVEYSLIKADDGDYILFGKNKNDGTNEIDFTVEFYNEKDEFIGKGTADLTAVSKNTEFAIDLYDAPKSYDHYKVFIDLEKTDNKSYTDKLTATATINDGKVVGQVKNTTDETIDYMSISVVYYKDNKVIGYDDTFIGETKPGRSANFDFYKPYDENYDDLEYDTYKIYINDAYSYSW